MVKHIKNGFFLIELMIGLSISTFFILIITHYIIEVKVTQQKALNCAEEVSMKRNQKERDCAKKYGFEHAS
jgi:Tfp pilus assembly protein PilW